MKLTEMLSQSPERRIQVLELDRGELPTRCRQRRGSRELGVEVGEGSVRQDMCARTLMPVAGG